MAETDAAGDKVEMTDPPKVEEETGIALHGEWPLNHRLRAEALARAGIASDPDGEIGDDLIADAKDRLAADDRAAKVEGDKSPALASMTKAQLEETAAAEGVDLSSAGNNADRVKLIEDARAAKMGA